MNEQIPQPDIELARHLGLELKPRRARSRRWFIIAGLVIAAIAAFAGVYFWRSSQTAAYVTAPVTRGALTVMVNATGTLQPQDQVDVGAEISGRLDEVRVDYNDRVTKGQVLAVINTDQIRAQLAQAQASLNANRATVLTNEATVRETLDRRDRARGLLRIGGISAQDAQIAEAAYDRAVASVNKARADVENAAAQVALYRTQLEKAQVRSPIDGVVLDRKVSPGQTVAAAFQTPVLFTLASDLSMMELAVDIDEADIGLVRSGQMATFTVDAYPDRRFDAHLVSVRNAAKSVNGVVTYEGVLSVDNVEMLLRPGLTATVDILVSQLDDALLVPNAALRFSPEPTVGPGVSPTAGLTMAGMGRVWVLENGQPAARDIRIGRSDGRSTQVLSGALEPGEQAIIDTAATTTR